MTGQCLGDVVTNERSVRTAFRLGVVLAFAAVG